MQTEFIDWLIKQDASYQIRYVDYEENQFTAPVKLTRDRADKLYDLSIAEIRFKFD